jgi:hypothetical protein
MLLFKCRELLLSTPNGYDMGALCNESFRQSFANIRGGAYDQDFLVLKGRFKRYGEMKGG